MENNLVISDINTLKELFTEPLYLIKEDFTHNTLPTNQEEESPIRSSLFTFTGKNLKKIVFMVFSISHEIPALDKELYTKTLSALKLENDDVALSLAGIQHIRAFQQIAEEFPAHKIICFADAANYGPELLSVKKEGESSLYFCPSLKELAENQELKIKWWNGLKSFVSQ